MHNRFTVRKEEVGRFMNNAEGGEQLFSNKTVLVVPFSHLLYHLTWCLLSVCVCVFVTGKARCRKKDHSGSTDYHINEVNISFFGKRKVVKGFNYGRREPPERNLSSVSF